MENVPLKAPDSSLASVLQNRAKNEADEKVIIPDECGDTLWDEVLAQNEVKAKDTHPDEES
jgi:hypothetical protein